MCSNTIYDLLKNQHSKNPEANVISAPGRTPLTYSRLYNFTEIIADQMSKLGIGRNDRLAIVLPNGPEIAVAF